MFRSSKLGSTFGVFFSKESANKTWKMEGMEGQFFTSVQLKKKKERTVRRIYNIPEQNFEIGYQKNPWIFHWGKKFPTLTMETSGWATFFESVHEKLPRQLLEMVFFSFFCRLCALYKGRDNDWKRNASTSLSILIAIAVSTANQLCLSFT